MKPKKYDVIVIGSGAGAKIARPAAQKGLKAAIIEKDKLGGTCLNRGCIPSKMLIHPADVALEMKHADKFQLKPKKNPEVNFAKLTRRINKVTDGDSNSIKAAYESGRIKGLDYYHGTATFESDKVIKINGKLITADKIVIGVGARPMVPPIPGLEGTPYMTSTEALRNRHLPKKMIVIGGGYIGCELGGAYQALGTNVHFFTRGGFIGRADTDLREEFTKSFGKRVVVHESVQTTNIEYKRGKFTIHYKQKGKRKQDSCDALLVATGVRPNNDLLKLENTKIKLSDRGFVKVNKNLETNVKGVYAFGDCVGNYMFRHSANFEAEYLFDELIVKKGRNKKPIKYPPMPWAMFTNPQVAGVGASEDELIAKKIPYVKGVNNYIDSAMGQALLSEEGFVKLLFHKKTKKLLGAQMIGHEASVMVHLAIIFMQQNAKVDDLLDIIYVHPALPEIFRNAARKAKAQF